MTRQEVERELMCLLEKAEKIAKEYSPNGGTLSMTISGNCAYIYNDASHEHNDKTIDVFRNKDGVLWSFGYGEIERC